MLTVSDVTAYLTQIGLALPTSIIELLVDQINSVEECLIAKGLAPASIQLALLQGLAVLAIGTGARRLKSHSAPSGASQSFDYGTLAEQGAMLRASIRALGAWDCLGPLFPVAGPHGGLMIGLARRGCK